MSQTLLELYTGKNKTLAGHVLLAYTFKTVKDTKHKLFGTKPDSKCVNVPSISDAEVAARIQDFMPKLQDAIHEERRLILRDAALGGATTIELEAIGLDAVLARWAEEATGSGAGRFTKAALGDWFASVLAPVLLVGIMAKQGIPADTPEDSPLMMRVEKTLELVLDALTSVVFSKKKPTQETIVAITAILGKLSADVIAGDATYELVASKLDAWNKATDVNLLDNLGL